MSAATETLSQEKEIKCIILQSIAEQLSYKKQDGDFENKTQDDTIVILTEYIEDNGSFIKLLKIFDISLKDYLFHRNYLWSVWKKVPYSSEQAKMLEPMLKEIMVLKKLLVRFFHFENPEYISMSDDDKKYFMIKFRNSVKFESAFALLELDDLSLIYESPLHL